MKEIIFIRQSTENMGGVQWQIVQLAQKLFSRGCFKPVLITSDVRSVFAQIFAARGFEVLSVPMSRAKILSAANILSAAKKIVQTLEGRDVALIQTHLFRESLVGKAVRRKRPDICHIVRAQTYINCSKNSKTAKFFYHLLDRTTSNYVDLYIANGRYLRDEIVNQSGVDPSKVEVVLNGRDSIGPPDEPVKETSLPLPAKIAMIANFIQGKGQDCLIKALAILKKKNLIIETRLIGGELGTKSGSKWDTAPAMKRLADKLGVSRQIEFYGYTPDVFNALVEIPVIVLPSDSEGVPNCIIEAMGLRKLVIASNTGGVGEIIEHGKTGLLHRPKDSAGLAELLQYVFTHKAGDFEQMRTAGFEKWKTELTGDNMVDKFVEIYRKVGVL